MAGVRWLIQLDPSPQLVHPGRDHPPENPDLELKIRPKGVSHKSAKPHVGFSTCVGGAYPGCVCKTGFPEAEQGSSQMRTLGRYMDRIIDRLGTQHCPDLYGLLMSILTLCFHQD